MSLYRWCSRGKIICSCVDVSENEIFNVLDTGEDFAGMQYKLKVSIECGSCMPELKGLLQTHRKEAA